MSSENTGNQPLGTKSHHITSGIIAVQPIHTIGEFLKDKKVFPEETTPAIKPSFNNRKHNKNLISLTGVLILLVLTIVIFFLAIGTRLGWISILNVQIIFFFCKCFVSIILPIVYFTYKPQNLILVLHSGAFCLFL